MLEDIFINMGVSALLVAIKNEQRRKQMRAIFLKIFKAIWLNFASDEEFQAVVGK